MSLEKVGALLESDWASPALMQAMVSRPVTIVASLFLIEDSNLVIWNSFKQGHWLIDIHMYISIAMTAVKLEGGDAIDTL